MEDFLRHRNEELGLPRSDASVTILKEAEQNGMAQNCRRHPLDESLIGKWRLKLEKFGAGGLEPRGLHVTREVVRIAKENRSLKQIVADQTLALQLLCEIQEKMDARSKPSAR